MPAIGIDLGSMYSCVAVSASGKVRIIPTKDEKHRTLSFSAIAEETGYHSLNENTFCDAIDVKHLIGHNYTDPFVTSHFGNYHFEIVSVNDKPMIRFNLGDNKRSFSVEEVYAMILRKLKKVAEDYMGEKVTGAVMTVPAYFNNAQRQATLNAATLAGLNILRIIDEPIAAAIAYEFNEQLAMDSNVLIFNLGRKTCDVSVLTIKDGEIEMKSTARDAHLGGEYFDYRMVSHILDVYERQKNKDISDYEKIIRQLLFICREAKHTLSSQLCANVDLSSCPENINVTTKITRGHFEDLNNDLFRIIFKLVDTAIQDAKMTRRDIDHIVLIGGSTRIPKVRQLLSDFFNSKALKAYIDPEEVIAYGAAVHAASLSGENTTGIHNLRIKDTSKPPPLGVSAIGEEEKQRVINCLKNYAHGMIYKMKERVVEERIQEYDRANIIKECREVISWLDGSRDVVREEYERRQKELESICTPVITKLFQSGGI